jgi:hypothetical protein
VTASLKLRGYHLALGAPLALYAFLACSGQAQLDSPNGSGGTLGSVGGSGGTGATGSGGMPGGAGGAFSAAGTFSIAGAPIVDPTTPPKVCDPVTCTGLGYACGYILDPCDNKTVNCADEGLTCGPLEACTGGLDGPTVCASSLGEGCTLCGDVPDCTAAPQPTRITGRVITPGRDDANVGNQVGVPNAFVYILRSADETQLPPLTTGIPEGGMACDRCGEQDLGQVLVGGLTDAKGNFTLEGNVPVGAEFLLVVKAGKFRRAVKMTLPADAACKDNALPTTLPANPARLPRTMTDGLAVNLPHIAVQTGSVDAIECVLAKMGISEALEFGNGSDVTTSPRVHLYRGGRTAPGLGASLDAMTPHDADLYGSLARMQTYDIVISDCEGGQGWDQNRAQRDATGASLRQYLNRGGRVFMSHLGFTFLEDNGDLPFDPADPVATGLAAAATWDTMTDGTSDMGPGVISMARPQTSTRIQTFADWMANEMVVVPPATTFPILQPRSQSIDIGMFAEEFVYREDGNMRTQQFSFNTPYGAPAEAICGRLAYSGFHVNVAGEDAEGNPLDNDAKIFPEHCAGDLSPQEKVLLYMLFDLAACVGEVPPPPDCTPNTCEGLGAECGFTGDGCGGVLDCGPCPIPPPK